MKLFFNVQLLAKMIKYYLPQSYFTQSPLQTPFVNIVQLKKKKRHKIGALLSLQLVWFSALSGAAVKCAAVISNESSSHYH